MSMYENHTRVHHGCDECLEVSVSTDVFMHPAVADMRMLSRSCHQPQACDQCVQAEELLPSLPTSLESLDITWKSPIGVLAFALLQRAVLVFIIPICTANEGLRHLLRANMRAQGVSCASLTLLDGLCLRVDHVKPDGDDISFMQPPTCVDLAELPAGLHSLKVTSAV